MRGRVAAIRPKAADSFFGHADPEGAAFSVTGHKSPPPGFVDHYRRPGPPGSGRPSRATTFHAPADRPYCLTIADQAERRPSDPICTPICAGQVCACHPPNVQFCAVFTITPHHLQAVPIGGYARVVAPNDHHDPLPPIQNSQVAKRPAIHHQRKPTAPRSPHTDWGRDLSRKPTDPWPGLRRSSRTASKVRVALGHCCDSDLTCGYAMEHDLGGVRRG